MHSQQYSDFEIQMHSQMLEFSGVSILVAEMMYCIIAKVVAVCEHSLVAEVRDHSYAIGWSQCVRNGSNSCGCCTALTDDGRML